MDRGVGIDYGARGRAGQWGRKVKNWDNCNSIKNKTLKNIKAKKSKV